MHVLICLGLPLVLLNVSVVTCTFLSELNDWPDALKCKYIDFHFMHVYKQALRKHADAIYRDFFLL